jgi:hypothetical protein
MFIEEEVVTPEVAEEEVTEVVETEEVQEEEVQEESIEEVKARLAKAEEIAENQRIRAEKAEAKAKEPKAPEGTLSSADLLAIMNAKVHEDDMERVEKFAKMEGVSIRQALKDPELKAILEVRAEQRTTAAAANTSNVRRGPTKASDETLVANASQGKLPDDDDGIDRLIAAKLKQK